MYSRVLELPLNIMKPGGVNPSQNTWIAKILSTLALASGVVTLITSVIEMYYVEWTIVTFAPPAETFFATLEVGFFKSFLKNCICPQKQVILVGFTKSDHSVRF